MGGFDFRPFKETGVHSYHRRSFHHDYHAPFIYHIILKKEKGCENYGVVAGDARIPPGDPGCARIDESLLGRVVAKMIIHLPFEYPFLKILQFQVMPDHIHFILQVLYRLDRHLDFYVEDLKERIAARYSSLVNGKFVGKDIFEESYYDKPLYRDRSLDGWYVYIRENPHRLAMRIQFPHFFQRVRGLQIGERRVEGYGNLFLFRNPDKSAVKISRRFTPEERNSKRYGWLSGAAKGTILVSPFISKDERAIRTEAEALGGKIILIVHEAFRVRYKPGAHDFELCSQGRMLIISLGYPVGTPLSRALCEEMNALAAEMAGEGDER